MRPGSYRVKVVRPLHLRGRAYASGALIDCPAPVAFELVQSGRAQLDDQEQLTAVVVEVRRDVARLTGDRSHAPWWQPMMGSGA